MKVPWKRNTNLQKPVKTLVENWNMNATSRSLKKVLITVGHTIMGMHCGSFRPIRLLKTSPKVMAFGLNWATERGSVYTRKKGPKSALTLPNQKLAPLDVRMC